MANLVITSENAGVKFEGNGVERVFYGFSTIRYSGQNKLDIVGTTKDNYSLFTIKFTDYITITVNGVAATNADNLQGLLDELSVSGTSNVIITDVNGNTVLINSDGQLHVVQEGKVDVSNSTSETLGIGGEFTGGSTETLPYAVITLITYSDKASAVDGLKVEFSSDNSNWDGCDEYTIAAATGKTFSFQPQAKYYRVRYINGGEEQTEFRLQTIIKKTYVKPSSHRIGDNVSSEDDSELVKAGITGEDPNGDWQNVQTTVDGNLTVSNNSSGLSIAEGNVTGKSSLHKFGNAPDFDTGDLAIDIWDGADDGGINEMTYNFSTSAIIDSLSSSVDADTQNIEIQGLDINYILVNQTITITGRTRKALDTNLIRIFRMKNVSSTDLAGSLYCYEDTPLNLGTPILTDKIRAIIDNGNNQTLMAIFTIPAGKTGYMRNWFAAISGANKNADYIITLYARPFGQVFQLKHKSAISDTGSSQTQHVFIEPEKFTEKTDILLKVQTFTVGVTAASISGGYDIVLVDN